MVEKGHRFLSSGNVWISVFHTRSRGIALCSWGLGVVLGRKMTRVKLGVQHLTTLPAEMIRNDTAPTDAIVMRYGSHQQRQQ